MEKNIEFFGIMQQLESETAAVEAAIKEGLLGASIYKSKIISSFEERLASHFRCKFAVTTSSCSDALTFALNALKLEPGSEVLVPAFSFIASASCVLRAGLVPVFVDIDRKTLSISLEEAENKITPQTKAMVFVHLFGMVSDQASVASFCARHRIHYIEDFAQAFHAEYTSGLKSTATCVSFNPTKAFGGLENGGAVLTDDPTLAQEVRRWTYHGRIGSEEPSELAGQVSLLTSMNALFLMGRLDRLSETLSQRLAIVRQYSEGLRDINGLQIVCDETSSRNGHKFAILCKERDQLQRFLAKCGVATRIHYSRPLPQEPVFSAYQAPCPNAEWISAHTLSLPIHTSLTSADVNFVIESVREFFASRPELPLR